MTESDLFRHQIRRFPSPLRYPGGKGSVSNFMKLVFIENSMLGADYVEPYAGGASVALSLLLEGYADHIHINDLDPAVFAFWNAVLTDTDRLCALINDTPVSIDEWFRQRAVQGARDPEPIDLAFSTFYMNRTNRSGIITGGVIGGRNQDGQWKLDARYNRTDLTRRIRKIARFSSRISLANLDALAFLQPWCVDNVVKSFVYLDPPYYTKGRDLYRNSYAPEDHAAVAKATRHLRVPWIVSYDADPNIVRLYKSRRSLHYCLSYSAAKRGKGPEVMFFAPHMNVPDVVSPAGIPVANVDSRLASLVAGSAPK
jgi:DNA adenine methylase